MGDGLVVAGRISSSVETTYMLQIKMSKQRLALMLKKLTWEEAQKACRAIGTDALAVGYDDKQSCIAKLIKSRDHYTDVSSLM
jgi:hypothetical protein